MAQPNPLYDLMLMLDTAAPEEQRQKILSDAEALISRGGEIVNKQDWGVRTMAFEIRHKTDAEYQLLQFHAPAEVLAALHRTLRITDGIVRFRIIKLAPGTPAPPEQRAEPRPGAEALPDDAPAPEADATEEPAYEAAAVGATDDADAAE